MGGGGTGREGGNGRGGKGGGKEGKEEREGKEKKKKEGMKCLDMFAEIPGEPFPSNKDDRTVFVLNRSRTAENG